MSENKIGIALVHEICPICGKPMNEQILMNSVLSKKYANEWKHIIKLRSDSAAHPNAQIIANMIKNELENLGYEFN